MFFGEYQGSLGTWSVGFFDDGEGVWNEGFASISRVHEIAYITADDGVYSRLANADESARAGSRSRSRVGCAGVP